MSRRFDRLGWALGQHELAPPLTSSQKFVLVVIADAANEDEGICWLKVATISERTALGRTAVKDATRHLTSVGLLRVGKRTGKNGRQTSNFYQLGCYDEHPEIDWRDSADVDTDVLEEATTRPPQVEVEGVATRLGEGSPADRAYMNQPEGTDKRHVKASPCRAPTRRSKSEPEDAGLQGDTTALWRGDEPEAVSPTPRRGQPKDPDSAWHLARYWSDHVLVRQGRLQGRREAVVRRHMAEWRRRGVEPAILRKMVDLFVADPAMRGVEHPWKTFVARADDLHQRAVKALDRRRDPNATISADALATIPEALRARFLEEAEDVA